MDTVARVRGLFDPSNTSRPPQYAFFSSCHYSKSCVFVHWCSHFSVSTSMPVVFLGQQFFVDMANFQTRIASFRDTFSSNGSFWFQMSRNNPNRFVFQSILTFFWVFCVLNCTHALNKNCIPPQTNEHRFVLFRMSRNNLNRCVFQSILKFFLGFFNSFCEGFF